MGRVQEGVVIPTTEEEAKELAQKGNQAAAAYVDVDVQCNNILE